MTNYYLQQFKKALAKGWDASSGSIHSFNLGGKIYVKYDRFGRGTYFAHRLDDERLEPNGCGSVMRARSRSVQRNAVIPANGGSRGIKLFNKLYDQLFWIYHFLVPDVPAWSNFSKVMEDSGAADSVSRWMVGKFGIKKAVLAIVIACAVLTYGGVNLFVVAFSVYPMALSLFKQADLPRRFIPAALAFGSVTFTMTSAGSPEIQNWIPIEYLGTSPYAGWEVSIIVAVFMMIFGYW